ncbi:MAG: putative AAA-ATPase [Firmicutes bacterium ADurb.Bin419]|nr:MAG: putative AAA-ATPase [Firmicutes bacterium ADurb.Bin419]
MTKKQVLQGIDNFKKLIDNNGYYVDKTLLIKELIDRPDQILLITRPRRFGKTLNMSMLKYFFEIPKCRQHDLEDKDMSYLFENLNITKQGDKYTGEIGKYPVVYLTFKNAKQSNWEETYENIKRIIAKEYERHDYLLESDILSEAQKERYKRIANLEGTLVDYTDVLIDLTEYLKRYFKEDCIVIIDEYDTPIQSGYIDGYYEKVIEFMKSMLVKGFKDNKALKQGILTGIMKVAQESIFSDFNNPLVCTLLVEELSDKFGFTESEVEEMAEYFGYRKYLEDVKKWYNGYIFGLDTVMYNPWSIIKYMYNPMNGLKPYWINTSDNRIIKDIMQLDKAEGKEVVEKLIKGEEVSKVIEENILYQSIKNNPDVAWSFLLHAGYLKAYDKEKVRYKFQYKLAIPNIEIQTIYEDMIINYFKEDENTLEYIQNIIRTLEEENIEKFERILKELYLKQVSYNDLKSTNKSIEELGETQQDKKYESFHHGFMLGLFVSVGEKYAVESNKEYGLGRPDIVLIPKDIKNTAYILEFKWESTKGSKSLEKLTDEAVNQIKEKKYEEGFRSKYGHKKIVCIGVGFKGKDLKMQKL